MIKCNIVILLLFFGFHVGLSQIDSLSSNKKERLDFAKMYLEVGKTFMPSFTGKVLGDDGIDDFNNSMSGTQYLNWGGFHFWGHGEFYVSFPLSYFPFEENKQPSSEIIHSVVTGYRYYPRVYREKKIIPYTGINWSAIGFKQIINEETEQPLLWKDFVLSLDGGIMYGYKNFALRLGATYFTNTNWDYPVSKTEKADISLPSFGLQVGLLYAWDSTDDTSPENIALWNSYPTISKQSYGSTRFGDFFVGIGPSGFFSLRTSDYNDIVFPYLKNKLSSSSFFDIAMGYNFNYLGLFTALSFRNPKFTTEGYGTKQEIKKTSFALEVNKFLIDYSGFTPYLGINLAYDMFSYKEILDELEREVEINNAWEPGLTIGWDIQPGKNQEALILRTNLRWYPFSSFEIDSKSFDFSQLEYNLIQVLFYPGRL